jgi:hypothetical protein
MPDTKRWIDRSRRALAMPLYLAAFAFHLLCAAFTILAAKVAGDPH